MSLQTRFLALSALLFDFSKKVRSALDLWNKLPIFVSEIRVIPLIQREYGGATMCLFIYYLKCRIFKGRLDSVEGNFVTRQQNNFPDLS